MIHGCWLKQLVSPSLNITSLVHELVYKRDGTLRQTIAPLAESCVRLSQVGNAGLEDQ